MRSRLAGRHCWEKPSGGVRPRRHCEAKHCGDRRSCEEARLCVGRESEYRSSIGAHMLLRDVVSQMIAEHGDCFWHIARRVPEQVRMTRRRCEADIGGGHQRLKYARSMSSRCETRQEKKKKRWDWKAHTLETVAIRGFVVHRSGGHDCVRREPSRLSVWLSVFLEDGIAARRRALSFYLAARRGC